MSKIEVNAIEPQCGTNLTVGASGDTITFPSGTTVVNNGSQSGFGRTGTVDWQTGSIKTATFTAANGEGYFCNTSGGAFTVNLPAGSAGAIVSVSDYTRTFQTNNLTVSPNGSEKIGGVAADAILFTEGQTATFIYVDGTEGWINTQETSNSVIGNQFILATGGTITTCGNDKIHTFTGPGTFAVSQVHPCAANNLVSYMVVAGGGAGAGGVGAGGGAGGYRELVSPTAPYTASPLNGYPTPGNRITVSATPYPITVGSGGAKNVGPNSGRGGSGGSSIFSTIISAGGGGGGGDPGPGCAPGVSGGSGGGGSRGPGGSGAAGNTPPTTPSQGNSGENGLAAPARGGGGGGAITTGGTPTGNPSTYGGNGATNSINGVSTTRAGGGGGGGDFPYTSAGSNGGPGGGGNSYAGPFNPNTPNEYAEDGTDNTGGGGGGGSNSGTSSGGANGGSGIVIIRYKFQ